MADIDDRSDARRTLIARLALATSLALFAALSTWLLIAGPPEVIGHFGANNGEPRFDPTPQFVVSMTVLVLVIVVVFATIPGMMRRIPIEFINMPNREQWNTPARREVLARRTGADMTLLGAATVFLFVVTMVLSTLGGLGETIPGWVFVVMTGAYLLLVALIMFGMMRSKRYDPSTLPAE